MSQIKLKRLLSKKSAATGVIQDLVTVLDPTIAIFDAGGSLLMGAETGDSAERFDIEVEEALLGWVTGGEQAPLIAQLATHLAIEETEKRALGNEVLDRYREVNLLFNLSEKIGATLELQKVAELVLDEASRLLETPSTSGTLILAQDGSDYLETVVSFGDEFAQDARYGIGRGIIGSVVATGKAELVDKIQKDPRYQEIDGAGRSLICAPIKPKQRVIGAIVLTGTDPSAPYLAGDLKLLNTLASLAAPAIESALFYERTVREAHEREAQRLQEQEIRYLKEINKLKDEFVRMVSHDLKNPIGVIIGYVDLIKANEYMEHAKGKNYIDRIRHSAQRMRALVTDLLDLAKIEDGLTFAMQEVPLDQFLKQCYEDFEFMAKEKRIDLVFTPPPTQTLNIDPDRVAQVIGNLLSNAIKYTPKDGRVELRAEVESQNVIIEVVDNGLGIPEADVPHLFEKFYRVSSEQHMKSEGTGLGLAIVKAIVDQHQGSIWAESKLGRGSTFYVQLPCSA